MATRPSPFGQPHRYASSPAPGTGRSSVTRWLCARPGGSERRVPSPLGRAVIPMKTSSNFDLNLGPSAVSIIRAMIGQLPVHDAHTILTISRSVTVDLRARVDD